MATTTVTTAIELESHSDNVARTTAAAVYNTNNNYSTGRREDDEVMRASLAADSEVPDGGYGWVVIFACALLCFWFVSTTYCWGVFQAALVEQELAQLRRWPLLARLRLLVSRSWLCSMPELYVNWVHS